MHGTFIETTPTTRPRSAGDTAAHLFNIEKRYFSKKLSAKEASRQLDAILDAFADAFIDWYVAHHADPLDDTPPPPSEPAVIVRAAAGLGKSVGAIRILQRLHLRFPNIIIFYSVPMLDLARELSAKMTARGLPSIVATGRAAKDENGDPICPFAEQAAKINARGGNVFKSLCKNGEARCPHYGRCSIIDNKEKIRNGFKGIILGAHNHLFEVSEICDEKNIELMILDESFHAHAARHSHFDLDNFLSRVVSADGGVEYLRQVSDDPTVQTAYDRSLKAFARIVEKMKRDKVSSFTVGELRDAGLTAPICREMKQIEYDRKEDLDLSPDMTHEERDRILDSCVNFQIFQYAALWDTLANALDIDEPNRVVERIAIDFDRMTKGAQEPRAVIDLFRLKLPRNQTTPLLILDAHADTEIISRLYEGRHFEEHRIDAAYQNTTIHQVADMTGSKSALAKNGKEKKIAAFADTASRILNPTDDPNRRAVVISSKETEDRLVAADRQKWAHLVEETEDGDISPVVSIYDDRVSLGHFQALRGRDHWKEAPFFAIVGRNEPPVAELQNLARCYFGDEAGHPPLEMIEGALPRRWSYLQNTRGIKRPVQVSYHPDHRVHALLWQIREAELEQAIARGRFVHRTPDNPAIVYIFTNIPLDIEVDFIGDFAELMPKPMTDLVSIGFMPMQSDDAAHVISHRGGRQITATGIRSERSRWLADQSRLRIENGYEALDEDSPNAFVEALCRAMPNAVEVRYKVRGCQKWRTAFIRAVEGSIDTEESLRRYVGQMLDTEIVAFEIVGTLPRWEDEAIDGMIDRLAEEADEGDYWMFARPRSRRGTNPPFISRKRGRY